MADYGNLGFALFVITIPLFIVGILGNVLVIRIVHKTPEMQSVTNYLLANLAVSDIITIFHTWPSMLLERNVVLKEFDCRWMAFGFTVSVSSFTLMVLAVERYHALLKPFKIGLRLKQENVKRAIAIIWISSVLIFLPNAIMESKWSEVVHFCFPSSKAYFFASFSIIMYIPLVVFLYCYGSLIKGLYFGNKICASLADRQEDRACEKKKLVITFMLATAGFVIGYGPVVTSYTLAVIGATHGNYSSVVVPILEFNYFCSLCLNPVLYAFRSMNFRQGFKRTIFCRDSQPQNEMSRQPCRRNTIS
ncbi:neuropeptide FF receptor 2-like [Montipora foliosa]|uniref:neuropeptide FF receptor 2-like n=1 Tax=Montipora foliosa TaxID=591990 RepID=UPI0035F1776C